ncbi:MAG TPA: hypothetical protein VGH11_07280 [Jatrophihabitans sp.]
MQVVILLLLVLALALLILGLVGNAPALVAASVVASLLTVYIVARARRRRVAAAEARSTEAIPAAEPVDAAASPTAASPTAAASTAAIEPVADERAADKRSADDSVSDDSAADDSAADDSAADELADEPAAATTIPPVADHGSEPVWVIDGRPRYHRWACEFAAEHDVESIPLSQAVADGFTACSLCDPDTALTMG